MASSTQEYVLLRGRDAFEHWVRDVLIRLLVDKDHHVCEVLCGRFLDISKLIPIGIASYTGFDIIGPQLADAQKRHEAKGKPFPSEFFLTDLTKHSMRDHTGQLFDAVMCHGRLQQVMNDKMRALNFLHNVSASMNEGGCFFGFVFDSSVMWNKAQRAQTLRVKDAEHKEQLITRIQGQLFTLDIPKSSNPAQPQFAAHGSRHHMMMCDGSGQSHWMIHFPTLIKIAERVGLQLVQMDNFQTFFQEQRELFGSPPCPSSASPSSLSASSSAALLHGVLDHQGRIPPPLWELLGLYTTFVFKKVPNNSSNDRDPS